MDNKEFLKKGKKLSSSYLDYLSALFTCTCSHILRNPQYQCYRGRKGQDALAFERLTVLILCALWVQWSIKESKLQARPSEACGGQLQKWNMRYQMQGQSGQEELSPHLLLFFQTRFTGRTEGAICPDFDTKPTASQTGLNHFPYPSWYIVVIFTNVVSVTF